MNHYYNNAIIIYIYIYIYMNISSRKGVIYNNARMIV